MTAIPLGSAPGIYQVCTNANTDYVITVPTGAISCFIWFETSASDATKLRGRVAFDNVDTAITSISSTSTNMGYHPDSAVEYYMAPKDWKGLPGSLPLRYLHVANGTALAVCRGTWLFDFDSLYA